MTSKSDRGRALLHDLGPAGGEYEVEYVIHALVQHSKHIGITPTVHKVSSVNVRSVNGYLLKDGLYALENNANEVFKLRKTGALWELVSEDQLKKKEKR
jgi:hypothetical protein